MLIRFNGRVRWIPHNKNPSDGLTKIKGAHLDPLMDLLRTGFYTLTVEEIELQNRAKEKEEKGGFLPRNKSTGQSKPVERLSHQVTKPVAATPTSRLAGSLFSKNKVGGTGASLGTGNGYTGNFSKIVGTFVQCHRMNTLTNAGNLGHIDMNPFTPLDDEAQGNYVLPRTEPFPLALSVHWLSR